MKFYKYHGTGNDFICIDNKDKKINLSTSDIKFLCDRNFGIGADGIILMEDSFEGDIFMNYFNADGTLAEMCGNGVRVTAHFFRNQWGRLKEKIFVETRSGIKKVIYKQNNLYQVNMGKPIFESNDFPKTSINLFEKDLYFVSMGNPHAVIFFDTEEELDLYFSKYAKSIESNTKFFSNKINVNGVYKISENVFGQKTYERGVGLTLACGTGASATFIYLCKYFPDLKDKKVEMKILGGKLFFQYSKSNEILMTGEAKKVFEGNFLFFT